MRLDGVALDATTQGSRERWVPEPGTHRLEARGRGVEPILRTIAIEAGETRTVSLSFTSSGEQAPERGLDAEGASSSRGKLRTLGLGGWRGRRRRRGVDDLRPPGEKYLRRARERVSEGCSDGAHRERIESGKSAQTMANVGLVLGAAGLAASGALLYLGFSTTRGNARRSRFRPARPA